jgi:6-phosphogluconolactonase (cycloisomerase 2 family)
MGPPVHIYEGEVVVRSVKLAAGISGVAALAFAGPAVAAHASGQPGPHRSPVVGHVYVNDNTTGTNTIGGFDRHANGTLTPQTGSPFAAGGSGSGAGTASQGALQQTPDGRFLLAVDAGSDQISVLRLGHDGEPHRVAGGTVSSHGSSPVSLAVTRFGRDDLVYVANAGATGGDYTGFLLNRRGILRHLSGSTVSVPDGSQLGDVLFNSTGTSLVGTRVATSLIDSFNVGRNGLLYAAAGSPYTAQGPGPLGSEFRPTNPAQLFVSNAHGGPNNGTISSFHVSRGSRLTSVGSGPFADHQTAPCWVEITRNGRFLFTTNTAVPSISRYSIAANGALTLLGSTALNPTTQAGPIDLRLAPNGKALYVVDGGAATISEFAVHGGRLTPLSGSPISVPKATAPVGIVVD